MASTVFPAAGGITTSDLSIKWTSIATATANNTSTLLTISSIPTTYNVLRLVLNGIRHNGSPSGSAPGSLRINGSNTQTDYAGYDVPSLGTFLDNNTNSTAFQWVEIQDYLTSGIKPLILSSSTSASKPAYLNAATVTSISIFCTQNLFSGTMTLWGGKF